MNVVNLICKSDYSFGDSLIVLVLGMFVVFAVLALLMGILYLLPVVLKIKVFNKRQTEPQTAVNEHHVESVEYEDEEIVAAITVAITHIRKEENIQAPFVIKKIKRN